MEAGGKVEYKEKEDILFAIPFFTYTTKPPLLTVALTSFSYYCVLAVENENLIQSLASDAQAITMLSTVRE